MLQFWDLFLVRSLAAATAQALSDSKLTLKMSFCSQMEPSKNSFSLSFFNVFAWTDWSTESSKHQTIVITSDSANG
jgi:hypothetical protein